MEAVILAGGKGTRLGEITKKIPKPMVKIGNKPILEHQIEFLAKNGFKSVWLLTGYKGEKISEYFGDGSHWGIKINYSQEEKPLGTAGAVKSIASNLLTDTLVLYGDIMANFDLPRFIKFHQEQGEDNLATLVIQPSDHPQESDLVEIENNQITKIYSKPHPQGVNRRNLANAAVCILSPKIFKHIKQGLEKDFGRDIFPELIQKGKKISGYFTWEYFRDMGNPERLELIRNDYQLGIYHQLTWKQKQKVVFIDLNILFDPLSDAVYPTTPLALRKLNQSNYLTILVVNENTFKTKDLDEAYRKLDTLLGIQGVKVDAICQNRHFVGDAASQFNLKIEDCYYLGISSEDFSNLYSAGIKSFLRTRKDLVETVDAILNSQDLHSDTL